MFTDLFLNQLLYIYSTGYAQLCTMHAVVDLLRNESPVRFGWYEANPNLYHLMTGTEPVGEGDGLPAEDGT